MKGYKIWIITWQWVQKWLKWGLNPKTRKIKVSPSKCITYKYFKLEILLSPYTFIALLSPVASSKRFERHFIRKQYLPHHFVSITTSIIITNKSQLVAMEITKSANKRLWLKFPRQKSNKEHINLKSNNGFISK